MTTNDVTVSKSLLITFLQLKIWFRLKTCRRGVFIGSYSSKVDSETLSIKRYIILLSIRNKTIPILTSSAIKLTHTLMNRLFIV